MIYHVMYLEEAYSTPKSIAVSAKNKQEAYDKAVYDTLGENKGIFVYSAWVDSVTYANGKTKHFNTFSGRPY